MRKQKEIEWIVEDRRNYNRQIRVVARTAEGAVKKAFSNFSIPKRTSDGGLYGLYVFPASGYTKIINKDTICKKS